MLKPNCSSIALEACALTDLWLCDGNEEVAAHVAGVAQIDASPFIDRPDFATLALRRGTSGGRSKR
jgi:hypothetical protein